MKSKAASLSSLLREDLNFLLTNRIPRRLVTRWLGTLTRVEQPLVREASMAVWRLFTDLDLTDAQDTKFRSLHDCFVRRLRPGARTIDADPAVLVSPCDAIVGMGGSVEGTRAYQAKGFPYSLHELLADTALEAEYADGTYVTLRLTSAMYHHFHAPHACAVTRVRYISGDTWNVNPIALRRVQRLFCRNERAVIETVLAHGRAKVTLVPVAAILVAGIRLGFIDVPQLLARPEPRVAECDAHFAKGEEMGWFEHGSTIIVFAPPGFARCPGIVEGARIRMGQPLLRLPSS
jgi:phosphatidylserine decarboxylase